eukprot:CAMPEP_0182938026 /NCGR_PEP_ID=MMETSP0105_2-20130417/43133_1 /TAXON_ID=81532 ORGANISM="Acanthoeca-like sp., Strain 10tr" /NCGR_SAMPLE_ID=MMETSP0105_2 /ASSEMBLY_ACC=CAM_ASM_000205 /LENGTH=93 /DNA_ID=CAMNT_0025077287 /DNA_START=182 /DNA_END=464 /DNA_ORIENTATION=+
MPMWVVNPKKLDRVALMRNLNDAPQSVRVVWDKSKLVRLDRRDDHQAAKLCGAQQGGPHRGDLRVRAIDIVRHCRAPVNNDSASVADPEMRFR